MAFLNQISIDFRSLFFNEKLRAYGYMKQFKKIMNPFFSRLVSCINSGEVIFGEYDETHPVVFTRRSSGRSERRRDLHAGLNRLHRMALHTATWRIALRQNGSLSSFSRGEGGRSLSGCNGRKGFWNMSRSCARKVLCIHLRFFCTIAAASDYAIVSSFLFAGL